MRLRWALPAGALAVAVAATVGARMSARALEQRAALVLQRKAAARGISIGATRVSWLGPAVARDLALSTRTGARVTVDEARVSWGLGGGREPRAHVRHVALRGIRAQRGPLVIEWPSADVDVVSWQGAAYGERVLLRQSSGGQLEARWHPRDDGGEVELTLAAFDLSDVRIRWADDPLVAPGTWRGHVQVRAAGGDVASMGSLSAEAVRVSLPRSLGLGHGGYGVPTSLALAWELVRSGPAFDLRRVSARLGGIAVEGHGRLDQPEGLLVFDLAVSTRTELGPAFQTVGLRLPDPVGADRLGTASLDLEASGSVSRPADMRIVPRLKYQSAPEAVEKLQFLRRPFRYRPEEMDGLALDVREGAPDFIPLADVPPLFVRALLLSEDAGFYGHPGVDTAEIPAAWAANAERGSAARGASTITQQLVKNLFLSKDKSYGRKVEEAALALIVDAAVPKARLLEIYVNVIEWGPGLYGLVPAARHYFGKRPDELTPKETAFLVCVIPSPIRYHQAHVAGHVGPGMEQLMVNLLAKLRSVDALGEDAYAQAVADELRFAPEGAPVPAPLPVTD
jgi:transglycosylase-like protein